MLLALLSTGGRHRHPAHAFIFAWLMGRERQAGVHGRVVRRQMGGDNHGVGGDRRAGRNESGHHSLIGISVWWSNLGIHRAKLWAAILHERYSVL